VAVSYQYQI